MVNNSSGRCKYAKANTNFFFSVKKCSELQPFHHVLFHVTEFRPHFCHTVCRKWRIFKTLCGMSLLKKYAHMLECLCSHTEEEKKKPLQCSSLNQFLVISKISVFESFSSSPFLYFLWGAERRDRKGLQRFGPLSGSLMDVRCVWEENIACVFHVSSQHDEQCSSWRWTEITSAPPTIPPYFIPTSVPPSHALLFFPE